MSGVTVYDSRTGLRFLVRVQPRASRSEIAGVHGGALKVRVAAPPADGAANDALISVLASAFGVARSRVRIVSGPAARLKTVEVEGIERQQLDRLTMSYSALRSP